jgi:hypothetical protein
MMFKDQAGTELAVGQTVAYNYSGTVALGRIEEIKVKKKKNWRDQLVDVGTFVVRQMKPTPGTLSRVTSEVNLLVVNPVKGS